MAIQTFNWPHLLGYHVNVTEDEMTPAAEAARVYPSSPECVWCGDGGEPENLHVYDEEGSYTVEPNPNGPVPFSTVFLLFVDQAEALTCLPNLALNIEP